MKLLTRNDIVKLRILLVLKKSGIKISVSSLSTEVEAKYETVRKSINFLIFCKLLKISAEQHGNLTYEYVSLTDLGKSLVEGIDDGIFDKA